VRDAFLDLLVERTHDVSPWTRAHVLKVWAGLLESHSVPVRAIQRVAEIALDRLKVAFCCKTHTVNKRRRYACSPILIPPSRFLSFPSVVSGVVAVVQDKAVAVRKNALALLSCVLDNNPFAGRCVRVRRLY
jgi:hypothetical protein